jgi:hypothetical protein
MARFARLYRSDSAFTAALLLAFGLSGALTSLTIRMLA